MGRETCNNNSGALNSKAIHELLYSIASVDCTRELSGSYNGSQQGRPNYIQRTSHWL